ncbi:hypothetical protein Salat_1377400 [Sesamum alatum]|uniref:Uncharacterized protein n=1 Tax=Sesamum alatum TaxID=300844 RepID=A0AAE1Y9V2_9LAMI|nr:hypothetical protein Salat_1377400 [Sesamum alatum]
MKRQGGRHRIVRAYPILSAPRNPRSKPRNLNELSSPPTAGALFTKVSPNPTKFTGKCGRPRCRHCHVCPAGKSKDKVKGAQKMRSSSLDYRLIAWRGMDPESGKKFSWSSATGVLDYLADDDMDCCYEANFNNDDDECYEHEIEEVDEEEMSLCEVGLFWELVDRDENWCLVEEI